MIPLKYENIKTPEDLLRYMEDNIEYGFVSDKNYTIKDANFNERMLDKWALSLKDELLYKKYGTCFDQVELERYWFKNHGYKCKTFFIWFELEYANPYKTHTYLVYEKDDKYFYFENADTENKGIVKFDSYEEAIEYQMKRHLLLNNEIRPLAKNEIESLRIYEYSEPYEHFSFDMFIDFILDEGKPLTKDI